MIRSIPLLLLCLSALACAEVQAPKGGPTPEPTATPKPEPPRVVTLWEPSGVVNAVPVVWCDTANGNLIYGRYKYGLAVVPGGCKK